MSLLSITPSKQFFALTASHIATVYWVFNYLSLSSFLFAFFVYFLTGCFGMTMTFHRLLTHRSWAAPKWFEYLGTFLGTVGLQGSSLAWTCAHRLHHAKADKVGDPHSPSILGYFRAHFLSMYSPINIKYSPVIRSRFHIFMHRYYFHINILYGFILYLIGGLYAVLTFWLVPAVILWQAGNIINTLCHSRWFGYRRYNTPDNSVSNPLMGVFMWGEGWHNNHHRFQNRANIGEQWWEIDMGYCFIRLLNQDENKIKT